MSQLYARVFVSILDSSLAENWEARHVFEDCLKLADGGILDMTRESIARRTNVPLEVVNRAIAVLEGADPKSRDPSENGRRLVRLDAHRDWGWIIVNFERYETIRSKEDQRALTRERVRRHRETKRGLPLASPSPKDPDSDSDSSPDAEEALPSVTSALQATTQSTAEAVPASKNGKASLKPSGGNKSSEKSDAEWLAGLKQNPAYTGLDVDREYSKMLAWCDANHKQTSRRRFVNWLNRADKPLTATTRRADDHTKGF